MASPPATQPEHEAITINYKVQTVYHHAKRIRTLAPGLLTALTAAVEVLRNAPSEIVTVATAGAIDIANAGFVNNGHYEIIITTSMVSMKKYLFRTSSIYYINDVDFWHYQSSNGKAKEIRMTNSDYPAQKTGQAYGTDSASCPGNKKFFQDRLKTYENPHLLFLLLLLCLSGCTYFNGTRLEGYLGADENLISLSYKISEDLEENAVPRLMPRHPDQPLLTTTFVDNNDLNQTSRFGRILQEHITSRFVQLGYTVKEIKIAE